MKNIYFLAIIPILTILVLSSCSKDEPVSNPFVGAWRDIAFLDERSYHEFSFTRDMSYQSVLYNGMTGGSIIEKGKYSYSDITTTITCVPVTKDGIKGEPVTYEYTFIDAATVRIGGLTYFRQ